MPEFGWTEDGLCKYNCGLSTGVCDCNVRCGRLIDRLGTKIGYALSLVLWSIAAMGHALMKSTGGFFVARAALGVTESGNFPAAIKATAEWFPKE